MKECHHEETRKQLSLSEPGKEVLAQEALPFLCQKPKHLYNSIDFFSRQSFILSYKNCYEGTAPAPDPQLPQLLLRLPAPPSALLALLPA